MQQWDRLGITTRVSTSVVASLKKEPETAHLQTFTKAHSEAWIAGMEEVVEDLQKAIAEAKKLHGESPQGGQ